MLSSISPIQEFFGLWWFLYFIHLWFANPSPLQHRIIVLVLSSCLLIAGGYCSWYSIVLLILQHSCSAVIWDYNLLHFVTITIVPEEDSVIIFKRTIWSRKLIISIHRRQFYVLNCFFSLMNIAGYSIAKDSWLGLFSGNYWPSISSLWVLEI